MLWFGMGAYVKPVEEIPNHPIVDLHEMDGFEENAEYREDVEEEFFEEESHGKCEEYYGEEECEEYYEEEECEEYYGEECEEYYGEEECGVLWRRRM